MPDPVQTETTQEVVTETPKQDTPQNTSREQLYSQYYKNDTPAPTEPVVTPPAQAPDVQALIAAQAAELAQMKAILAGLQATPPPAQAPPQPKADWFQLLQEGKRTEAEQVLKDFVAQGASEKIVQETVRQALELSRTEREIEDFNNYTRSNNPDMLDVEDLVSLKAEQKFRANQDKIKSTKDYIETYKKSVADSVLEMRQILQRTRAAGKNEGLTIRKEVLNSSTVNPNRISLNRDNQPDNSQAETPEVSTESYLEMRKSGSYRARNPQVATQQG